MVRLPDGKDPDEVVRETPDRWREEVRTAQPIVEYLVDTYAKTYDLKTAGRQGAIRRCAHADPARRAERGHARRLPAAHSPRVGRRGARPARGAPRRPSRGSVGSRRRGRRAGLRSRRCFRRRLADLRRIDRLRGGQPARGARSCAASCRRRRSSCASCCSCRRSSSGWSTPSGRTSCRARSRASCSAPSCWRASRTTRACTRRSA